MCHNRSLMSLLTHLSAPARSEMKAEIREFLCARPSGTLAEWATQSEWVGDTGGARVRCPSLPCPTPQRDGS